jgi:methylmalonyl-CoA/ethylmalonyl-CoA epimerase
VTSLDALPAGPLEITQVGVVVRDLWATMERYHRALGWGPWYVYEYTPPWFHSTRLRGEPVEFTMIGAEVEVGEIWFELVQPLDGPSIYKEWLDAKGEGLHHILVGWAGTYQPDPGAADPGGDDDVETRALATCKRFAELGAGVLMSGRLGTYTQFYYLDTEPLIKVIIESGGGVESDLKPASIYP